MSHAYSGADGQAVYRKLFSDIDSDNDDYVRDEESLWDN